MEFNFRLSARDFSPTRMEEVELPASSSLSSSASASTTMRSPSSFSGPPIEEWCYTIPLAPEVPPATSSAPNAVPSRVAPVNRAPDRTNASTSVSSWTCFRGNHSRHRLRARIFTAGFTIACAGRSLPVPRLDRRPIYRPRSARPRFCCRDCFGGNAPCTGSGVSCREQVAWCTGNGSRNIPNTMCGLVGTFLISAKMFLIPCVLWAIWRRFARPRGWISPRMK